MVTAEPWTAQIKALGGHTIFDSKSVPGRIVDVVAVRADAMEDYPEALRHLVATQFLALDLFRKQPEQSARLLSPRLQIAPSEITHAFDGLMLPDRHQNQTMLGQGGVISKNLSSLQTILLNAKLMTRALDLNNLLDDRFVLSGSAS